MHHCNFQIICWKCHLRQHPETAIRLAKERSGLSVQRLHCLNHGDLELPTVLKALSCAALSLLVHLLTCLRDRAVIARVGATH